MKESIDLSKYIYLLVCSLVVGDDGFLGQLFPPIAAVLGERHNNS